MKRKTNKPKSSGAHAGPAKRTASAQPAVVLLPGFWQTHRVPALALFVLGLVTYGMTVAFGYLQDDQLFIWDNLFVQKGFAGLREIFANDSLLGYYKDPKLMIEGGRYRPIPVATFALEVGLFGKDHPWIAHLVNVLLYSATGVLLYRILTGLFPMRSGSAWYFTVPFLAAALFLLHPLHTEVVANIKGRDEILALLFSLYALYGMIKYGESGQGRWLAASAAGLFLGLLSKENAVTYLAVIPLTLWLFTKIPAGRVATGLTALLGATALFLVVRAMALGYFVHQGKPSDDLIFNPFSGMNPMEKLATIFLSLGWDLKLLFVPYPLTHDYYPYHVPKVNWSDWRAGLSLAVYLVMGVWAVRQLWAARKAPESSPVRVPAYSILYFLLTLSVVSNLFVDTSTFMNERYLYMPSIGFCLLLAWLLVEKLPEWLQKPAGRPAVVPAVLLGLIVLAFAVIIELRLPDWGGKGEGLVESAMRIAPNSYRSNFYYANMLYYEKYVALQDSTSAEAVAEKKALLEDAEQHVDHALEIYPAYKQAAVLKAAIAGAHFREDRQLDRLLGTFENLLLKQSYNSDLLVYVLDVLKSLQQGWDPNVYNAFCHRIGYGLYFKKYVDYNGAIAFLEYGLQNYPMDPNVVQALSDVYMTQGNTAKAAEMQQRLQAIQAAAGQAQ
ncbi:MAG: glycosyltransferase family 39 protein [Lewinellaceae bacterium]|nr:glycosyltransferase family 39 protein [Saprospiraceae bacterium]MCB9331430.1 glycosyltransferase family 39 protein [Lewinellaceae bacterium]